MRNEGHRSVDLDELLRRIFCCRHGWVAEVVQRVAGMAPVPEASEDDRDVIGRAIEYAIGLDLAQDAYASRRSVLPGAHAEWIAAQVEESRTSQSHTSFVGPVEYPIGLLQSAFHLARYDQVLYKSTERWPEAVEVVRMVLADYCDHPAHTGSWRAAGRELGELWKLYAGNARDFLAARTPVVAAPVLGRGDGPNGPYPEAIADLIAAETLVEVKAGSVDERGWRSGDVAIQMMRYAVLAPAFGYPVTEVALYLARYGVLLPWELTDLAAQLAGHPVDLDHLRERLCPRSVQRRRVPTTRPAERQRGAPSTCDLGSRAARMASLRLWGL